MGAAVWRYVGPFLARCSPIVRWPLNHVDHPPTERPRKPLQRRTTSFSKAVLRDKRAPTTTPSASYGTNTSMTPSSALCSACLRFENQHLANLRLLSHSSQMYYSLSPCFPSRQPLYARDKYDDDDLSTRPAFYLRAEPRRACQVHSTRSGTGMRVAEDEAPLGAPY